MKGEKGQRLLYLQFLPSLQQIFLQIKQLQGKNFILYVFLDIGF
jgi:hypothetical protein